MADAKAPAPAKDAKPAAKAGQDRTLKIPGPTDPPLAVQGGEDMAVSGEPGPVGAPTGPTGPPELKKDPGINAHIVS